MKKISHIFSYILCGFTLCACVNKELDIENPGFGLTLNPEISAMSGDETKADLLNSGSDIPGNKLTLYGWENSTYWIKGDEATCTSGEWSLPSSYTVNKSGSYSYLSYANLPSSGASVAEPANKDSITLQVTDITKAQTDVLLGRYSVTNPTTGDVQIEYSHPFASVAFKLGNTENVDSISAITLDGVISSGKVSLKQNSSKKDTVMNYSWFEKGDANATLSATGLNKKTGEIIATFVVIPQSLADANAIVTVSYKEDDGGVKKDAHLTKVIKSGSWVAGYTTTYTLNKFGSLEIQVGGQSVRNYGSAKIYVRAALVGAWYDASGNVIASWTTSPSEGTFTALPGNGWTDGGDYYYYTKPLGNEEEATALYTNYVPIVTVPGATLRLDMLIQAIPYDVNKTCQQAFEDLAK